MSISNKVLYHTVCTIINFITTEVSSLMCKLNLVHMLSYVSHLKRNSSLTSIGPRPHIRLDNGLTQMIFFVGDGQKRKLCSK
jgi:hypothetical protein